ncbi:hypothetical protein [Dyadobacter sandarakinus]|uniref:Por secretion system C-terminal sorting domain-containing protein n=1 Tax=Dyadobacter sandarakinus TaxID=2747268 RepID=A0ABX7I9J8_9BACT|nr:hypothetical protein [Dyadobacter sandarakinus]QRR02455.1 hypothetical protein HWI92_16815 [Dyadobacter sandarakinus]
MYALNPYAGLLALLCLLCSKPAAAQPFQAKWTMDNTQAGSSSHANFTPQDASLLGGPNTYALASIYSPDGHGGMAYIVRPWPAGFSVSRSMEFGLKVNAFKYDITSISFRLRRSPTGTTQVKLRTSADGFAADVATCNLPNADVFYNFTIPVSFLNLTAANFSIRLCGYNATNATLGVLWFDDVVIGGQVLPIVLPISLTYLRAATANDQVTLSWETAWEKNSDYFAAERSVDMQHFEPIARIPASGETVRRNAYQYTDNHPLPGTSYYRLRLTDRDGTFTWSYAVSAATGTMRKQLVPAPNPASPGLIRLAGTDLDISTLVLRNKEGRRIPAQVTANSSGYIDIVPVSLLLPGIYLLSHGNGEHKEEVKVLVP